MNEQQNTPQENSSTKKIIGSVVAVALIAGAGVWAAQNKGKEVTTNTQNSTSVSPTPSTTTPTPTSETADSRKYKNGTYSATGTHTSPAGKETVDVTITLTDDVITAVEFKGNASNPTSVMLQSRFASGYKEQVMGKKIDEVSLTVVNGSSLTPKGFMDALAKIKVEANA